MKVKKPIPKTKELDSTLSLINEGFDFLPSRRKELESDIFGTNRHPDHWDNADEFIPERFENWKGSPFAFIPQGGSDHHAGHRCAGEWMTVMVMQSFFKYLTENISYKVPEQDLSYNMARMPTMPKSRFIISDVMKIRQSPENIINYRHSQTVM